MTDRARAYLGSTATGLHFQISKLLVASIICATAATGALIIAVLVALPVRVPPPGPNGLPPPPPDLQRLAVLLVITGLFVLAWLAVIVVFSRDQILLQIREIQNDATVEPATNRQRIDELVAQLRTEISADRERDLHALGERIAALTTEYGERRETDGYLNGMRAATTVDDPVDPTVRPIRRTPPQR
jgi:hypothetical protein